MFGWFKKKKKQTSEEKLDRNIFVYHNGLVECRTDIHELAVVLAKDERWKAGIRDLGDLDKARKQVEFLLSKGEEAPMASQVLGAWEDLVGKIVSVLREQLVIPSVKHGGLSSAAVMSIFKDLIFRMAELEEKHCFLSILPARQANSLTASTKSSNSPSTSPDTESQKPV